MARPHIPRFSDLETQGNVSYTVYFDKLRVGRGGGAMVTPSDPKETPNDMAPSPKVATARFEKPKGRQPRKADVGGRDGRNQRKPQGCADALMFDPTGCSNSHGTYGARSRKAAIPAFDSVDPNDLDTGNGFTIRFNEAREIMKSGKARVPDGTFTDDEEKKQDKCHCFPWGRK